MLSQGFSAMLNHVKPNISLVGGLEHSLFSPIVGMMIQSALHIFQDG
jgi:hypothetical protein